MDHPRDKNLHLAADWESHGRCWMAWPPSSGPGVGQWGDRGNEARENIADIARRLAAFQSVCLLANPGDVAEASLALGFGVAIRVVPNEDPWISRRAPHFLVDGRGEVAFLTGRQGLSEIGEALRDGADREIHELPLALYGGALEGDGRGNILIAEEGLCALNPGLAKAEIESLLRERLPIESAIWISTNLVGADLAQPVASVARFLGPGRVAILGPRESDPDRTALDENRRRLSGFDILEMVRPKPRKRENGQPLFLSYLEFYRGNGVLLVPAFEDAADQRAYDLLVGAFLDFSVLPIPALGLARAGGGLGRLFCREPKGEIVKLAAACAV